MIATRITSLFFLAFTLSSVAATPTFKADAEPALAKRASFSDVEGVLNTLKNDASAFSSSINNLVAKDDATKATLTPVFNDLKTALDTATSSLKNIKGPVSTANGPSVNELGALTAGIIADIAKAIDSVKNVDGVDEMAATVDSGLNQLLFGLAVLVAGILIATSVFLPTVILLVRDFLRRLGLYLVVSTLKL